MLAGAVALGALFALGAWVVDMLVVWITEAPYVQKVPGKVLRDRARREWH